MLAIEKTEMSEFLKKSVAAMTMSEAQRSRVFAGSNMATAAPFLKAYAHMQLYAQDVPRESIHEQQDEMDQSTDVVSAVPEKPTDKMPDDISAVAKKNYLSFITNSLMGEDRRLRQEQKEKRAKAEAEQQEQARRKSVVEAQEFLEKFVRARWATNLSNGHVKIRCELTMDEVKEIGRLDQFYGSRECRKLITAPVIHDAIGHALWVELCEQAAKDDADKKPEEDMAVTKAPPTIVVKKAEKRKRGQCATVDEGDGDGHRRTRSLTRRATEGDVIPIVTRTRSAYAVPISERNRRRSERPLVRPDQVMCTTCGSRAMGSLADDDDDEAMETDEDESDDNRQSISRRISLKMSKKLTALGGGVASGYGGSRLIA